MPTMISQSSFNERIENGMIHRADCSDLKMQVHSKLNSMSGVIRDSIQVVVGQSVIELHGQVDSFYAKQMAQESLRCIAGVDQIDNRLHVR